MYITGEGEPNPFKDPLLWGILTPFQEQKKEAARKIQEIGEEMRAFDQENGNPAKYLQLRIMFNTWLAAYQSMTVFDANN